MIVDDWAANRQALEEVLRDQGYEAQSFPGGPQALAAAAENPPEVILLDINMPQMNGYEVCERLRNDPVLCAIPVIFLSALDDVEDKIRGFRAGGVDYIAKPFRIEEVQARVQTHIRLRRLQREIEDHNSHLQDLVRVQVRKIAEAQLSTIFAIARLADSRDAKTGEHLERVQNYCVLLAEGLADSGTRGVIGHKWLENLYHASPLHDIGKVAIPDRILLKPGKLTPEEFEVMKTHSIIGAQTLMAVHEKYPDNDFIAMGIHIARSHHERWDGTGYPDRLPGDAIPLSARIVAVADVYDALRSVRPYKPSLPHEEVLGIILAGAGTQFDPSIVEIFIACEKRFAEISSSADAPSIPQDDIEAPAELLTAALSLGRPFLQSQ